MSDAVKDWLRTKRVQIWGSGGWDLTDEYELGLAAEWFTRELADFGDHIFYGYGADLHDYFRVDERVARLAEEAAEPWFPGLWGPPAPQAHGSQIGVDYPGPLRDAGGHVVYHDNALIAGGPIEDHIAAQWAERNSA